MEYKDYYRILEIDSNSTTEEIRQSFRKLARKYHPDVNPDDAESQQRFFDINESHQVLTHADARAKYNRLSAAWQTHQDDGATAPFDWAPWLTGYTTDILLADFVAGLEKSNPNYSDFFAAVFGELGIDPSATSAGQDYHQQVEITLEEAFTGASRIIRVGGRRLEVRVPKGAQSGTKVRVRGEGRASLDGRSKGDLYLEIEVAPHPSFERKGDDLHLDLPVNVYSAVLGGEAILPTMRGKIKLKIPPETQSGRVFRIKGQGMPTLKDPEERGDLYARIMITVPENLTEEEIELFEELADIRGL
jgi:curved DNA-binding protein